VTERYLEWQCRFWPKRTLKQAFVCDLISLDPDAQSENGKV